MCSSKAVREPAQQVREARAILVAEALERGLDRATPIRVRRVHRLATLLGDADASTTSILGVGFADHEALLGGRLHESARPGLVDADRAGEFGHRHRPVRRVEHGQEPCAGDRADAELPGAAWTAAAAGPPSAERRTERTAVAVRLVRAVSVAAAVPVRTAAPRRSAAAPERRERLLDAVDRVAPTVRAVLFAHASRLHVT